MTTIAKEQPVVTLINVFDVDPENQQKLVDLLVKATRETMNKLPGFVSANIHKSLDMAKVVNYAQWRTKEDFESMLKSSEAQAHMQVAVKLAKHVEPHLYEVSFIDEKKV